MLMYQVDSLRRALVVKEGTHQAQVAKLEDQIRQMKNQLLSSKEVSNQYQRLESDFRNLTERYTDRIENSQEVASNLSKDIFELNYIYRNTTASQLDSQEELLKKLEVVINQFSLDRDTNSKRIGELKHFLDRNIAMMKNNWDHKRCVEVQTDPYPLESKHEGEVSKVASIWDVVNHYGEA